MPLRPDLPPPPADGAPVNAVLESAETLALLATRRSTKIAALTAPGPDREQIEAILRLGARVPDHGKLGPWRFLVIAGDARGRIGRTLADIIASDPDVTADRVALEKARFERAPVCIAVVSTAAPHAKIPEWEQVMSAGAVCYGLLLAAHAMGFAGCWLTEWPTYDARARAALGLAEHERVAGFVYLGSTTDAATERARPSAESRTIWL